MKWLAGLFLVVALAGCAEEPAPIVDVTWSVDVGTGRPLATDEILQIPVDANLTAQATFVATGLEGAVLFLSVGADTAQLWSDTVCVQTCRQEHVELPIAFGATSILAAAVHGRGDDPDEVVWFEEVEFNTMTVAHGTTSIPFDATLSTADAIGFADDCSPPESGQVVPFRAYGIAKMIRVTAPDGATVAACADGVATGRGQVIEFDTSCCLSFQPIPSGQPRDMQPDLDMELVFWTQEPLGVRGDYEIVQRSYT